MNIKSLVSCLLIILVRSFKWTCNGIYVARTISLCVRYHKQDLGHFQLFQQLLYIKVKNKCIIPYQISEIPIIS